MIANCTGSLTSASCMNMTHTSVRYNYACFFMERVNLKVATGSSL